MFHRVDATLMFLFVLLFFFATPVKDNYHNEPAHMGVVYSTPCVVNSKMRNCCSF